MIPVRITSRRAAAYSLVLAAAFGYPGLTRGADAPHSVPAPPDSFNLSDVSLEISVTAEGLFDDRFHLEVNGDRHGRFVGCRKGSWRRASFWVYSDQLRRILDALHSSCFFDLKDRYQGTTAVSVETDGTARAGAIVCEAGRAIVIEAGIGAFTKTVTVSSVPHKIIEGLVEELLAICESSDWSEVDASPIQNPPRLSQVGREDERDLIIRVHNPGNETFWYFANNGSPVFVVEELHSGDWQRVKTGSFCGVGIREQVLAPGDSLNLVVPAGALPIRGTAVRIGVSFRPSPYEQCLVVWSPAFRLK